MASLEVIPAHFPENLWTIATFQGTTTLSDTRVQERLASFSQPWSPGQALTGRHHGWVMRREGPRVRLWRATFWRNSPSAAAPLVDLLVSDSGAGSRVAGSMRLGYSLGAWLTVGLAWPFLFFGRAGWPRSWVIGLALLLAVQLVTWRAMAGRDKRRLTDVVAWVMEDGGTPPVIG